MSQTQPLSAQMKATSIPIEIPMSYLHFNAGSGKPLLLLFHGYEDTAAGVLRRCLSEPEQFSRFEILAPNGLFPVPVRIENGFKQTHAWYFADFSKNQVLIPPQISAKAVMNLLEKLNLQDRPKILIGFSQGGFFLPFVSQYLSNVKKMFGVAAAYRNADYPSHLTAPLDALHGDEDTIVAMDRSQESFQALKAKNPKGEYLIFKGLGHTMNPEARATLKARIEEVFS